MSILNRLQHGWNAFLGRDPTPPSTYATSNTPPYQQSTTSFYNASPKDIINAALNRISVDVAALKIEHANLDEEGRYKEVRKSQLNNCLNVNANSDQTARMFMQDVAMSLLTEGYVAIVPTEATENPMLNGSYDIGSLRVCQITHWYPQHVTVNLYNEITGDKEERTYPKSMVAIPENPFYEVMNRPNSTYRRLIRKLRQLDQIDDESASGKLDIIIQVPYSTRSKIHKEQAETRRKDIEEQLTGSKYGVAYIDATEKVIQLNRAIENNLFSQVEYYTKMLFAQLGLPQEVFDGTADESVMMNYQSRTIEPIVAAIVDSMRWKFLTPSARRKQNIMWFTQPFKFATATDIANNADKFIRNEILTKNEFRQILGFRPSSDPTADELSNPNMPQKDKVQPEATVETSDPTEEEQV